MLRESRRGHSWLIGHEGCSWCLDALGGRALRSCVWSLVGAWGSLGDSWASLEGPEVVPRRSWASWEVLGRPWRVLERVKGVSGRSLGGAWGVLGAPLGSPWGAHHSLGGPGLSSGVHGGFLELVIFFVWEVDLFMVWRNIYIFYVQSFLTSSDVLYVIVFFVVFEACSLQTSEVDIRYKSFFFDDFWIDIFTNV